MSTPQADSPKADSPKTDSPETDAPNSVVTECDFSEAPEKVWKALTAPAVLARWLPEALESEILEAVPNKLLRYRWADGDGDKDAVGRLVESVVSFELTGAADGGTHLRVVHRVVEAARVIPFGPRQKAPVAMSTQSSCRGAGCRAPVAMFTPIGLLRRAA